MEGVCAGVHQLTRQLDKNRALIEEVSANHFKCVEFLVRAGVDVSFYDKELEVTALHRVSLNGNKKFLEILMKAGANVNARDSLGGTALSHASKQGHHKCLKYLIDSGAQVNQADFFGYTALLHAANCGHDKCVKVLIHAGADVNIADENGRTHLIRAVWRDHNKCTKLLLEAGADVNIADKYGNTPLLTAANYSKEIKCIKYLLRANCFINITNEYGQNAFECHLSQEDSRKTCTQMGMLLFAEGEKIGGKVKRYDHRSNATLLKIPKEFRIRIRVKVCLKEICRNVIRRHLIHVNQKIHLFRRIPKLGLPTPLANYLLYDLSLYDDDDNDFAR